MTTSATTEYAYSEIVYKGLSFWFDGNQKVTSGNGSYEQPAANAFSLPQVQACPFSTAACREACYVHNLEVFEPELHAKYVENFKNISSVLSTIVSPTGIHEGDLIRLFADYIHTAAAAGFRWHVSGDIFSNRYAAFIRAVARETPSVRHWIYTRSFPYLTSLMGAENLTINLSADCDNYTEARARADRHGLRVCYLTIDGTVPPDLREGDVIFPDYALRGVGMRPHAYREGSAFWRSLDGGKRKLVCPVDVYGKSEAVRCGPCRKCIDR